VVIYEITRRTQSQRIRRVVWTKAAGYWVSMKCSCEVPSLEGLTCRHLLAVYRFTDAAVQRTPQHFLATFKSVIPPFYKALEYCKGYEMQVFKPIRTCIEYDEDCLPPCDAKRIGKRGPVRMNRLLGPAERGWAQVTGTTVTVEGKPYKKKTKTNINKYGLDIAIMAEGKQQERSTRSGGTATVDVLEEEEEEEEKVVVAKDRTVASTVQDVADRVLSFFH
jgi:hypothetical protein